MSPAAAPQNLCSPLAVLQIHLEVSDVEAVVGPGDEFHRRRPQPLVLSHDGLVDFDLEAGVLLHDPELAGVDGVLAADRKIDLFVLGKRHL